MDMKNSSLGTIFQIVYLTNCHFLFTTKIPRLNSSNLQIQSQFFFQDLPETQRADAVSSMVYEANARIRDPVYGSAGAICHLQKQLSEVQAQLARAQAELVNMQCQQANLLAVLCMEVSQTQECSLQQQPSYTDTSCFLDDNSLGSTWEPLWT